MISDERFRKREHLLKSKEFDKVYRKGLAARAEGVILYCLPNALGHNRLGFSIGSKNVRLATSRNRIRRLFREVYRKVKSGLRNGFDIVMVVRSSNGTFRAKLRIVSFCWRVTVGSTVTSA